MTVLVRRAGQAMLGWLFLTAGSDVFRHPEARVRAAGDVLIRVRRTVPALPDDATVVRTNAAVQVIAGAALAAGRVPRLSSLVLAASLVPTTLAGHAFWKVTDPAQRAQQRVQFNKNLATLGGLFLAASWPHESRLTRRA